MLKRCDFKHLALPLGLMFAFFFTIFYFWGYTNSEPAVRDLHLNLLKLFVLGFPGLNGLGFFLGLMQSFIWGLILSGVFFLFHRTCPCAGCGQCGGCGECSTCGGQAWHQHDGCDTCDEDGCCGECDKSSGHNS